MRIWLEQETVESIAINAGLPETAVEHQIPELFEAIAEYVVNSVLRAS